MTLSLRRATLALLGGAGLVIAASGAASAGAPNGYFAHGRYFGPDVGLPPPAYVEVVPVYPAPVYPAPIYPPAYAAPGYGPPAPIGYEDGHGYGYDEPGFEYFTPDGAFPVGAE